MTNPIETAAVLYRELKRRGLEIRRPDTNQAVGRDNALFDHLRSRLKCPDDQLQKFLDTSRISAEEFLRHFLRIAQPFSQMYEQIWQYLADVRATQATEAVAVRFGFDDAGCTSVDLDQFRRHVEMVETAWRSVFGEWPVDRVHELYQMRHILLPNEASGRWSEERWDVIRYEFGKPCMLPPLDPGAAEIVRRVHGAMQLLLDRIAAAGITFEDTKGYWQQQTSVFPTSRSTLANAATFLHDLVPSWSEVFAKADRLMGTNVARAEEYLRQAGIALAQAVPIQHLVRQALDVLELPFWRHRWHTFEIWATVAAIRALEDYRVEPIVVGGELALSRPEAGIIARITDNLGLTHCLAAQIETGARGSGIRPDLRACRGEHPDADNTVAILEYKQRSGLTAAHVQDVCGRYEGGSPQLEGLVMLNYDRVAIAPALPAKSVLIQDVRPGQNDALEKARRCLRRALHRGFIYSPRHQLVILLDLSASMRGAYDDLSCRAVLSTFDSYHGVLVMGFNEQLVGPIDPLVACSKENMAPDAGTNLHGSLTQLHARLGTAPELLLLVTDGEHDGSSLLRDSRYLIESRPADLGRKFVEFRVHYQDVILAEIEPLDISVPERAE